MGLEAIEKMKESSETENKIVQKFTKTTEKTTKIVNDEENFSNGTEGGKERYIKLTTFYSTGEAGCPRQLDPERSGSVKLEVSLDDIDVCNKTLLKVILAAAGRPVDSNQKIKYTVNDFPFQRQNRNRAFEILRDMLDHVAGPDAPILNENEIKNLISKCDLDQDSILNLDHSILNDNSISKIGTKIHKIVGDKNEAGTSSNLKVLARREKISTDFPQDWLPTKKK